MDKTGIEFTVKMSRLIFDGKIIGYEYKINGITWQREMFFEKDCKLSLDYSLGPDTYIHHDSFNEGIKVGDEWWFTGDKITYLASSGEIIEYTLIYGDGSFWIHNKEIPLHFKLSDLWSDITIPGRIHYKKIGNIYEK